MQGVQRSQPMRLPQLGGPGGFVRADAHSLPCHRQKSQRAGTALRVRNLQKLEFERIAGEQRPTSPLQALKNRKHRLRLQTNPHLRLIVEWTVQTASIKVKSHEQRIGEDRCLGKMREAA